MLDGFCTEAGKLAYADREQYYGDPDCVEVPDLLNEQYAKIRSELVDMHSANAQMQFTQAIHSVIAQSCLRSAKGDVFPATALAW